MWDPRTGAPSVGETRTLTPAALVCCFSPPGLEGRKGQWKLHSLGIRVRAVVAPIPRKRPIYSKTTVMRRQIPWTRYGSKGMWKYRLDCTPGGETMCFFYGRGHSRYYRFLLSALHCRLLSLRWLSVSLETWDARGSLYLEPACGRRVKQKRSYSLI